MKAATMVAAFLAGAVSGLSSAAYVTPYVGLVHVDERDTDTYYYYLAAVPVFKYYDAGRRTETPLLTDDAERPVLPTEEGASASRLVAVGHPRTESVAAICRAFGVADDDVVTVEGEVPAVAAELAATWTRARDVVVAPYAHSPDATLAASGSYAAALASTLNAPLLFTYTKRLPPETLSALRRLGAKNLYLVDFGGRCHDGVRAPLKGDSRKFGRAFERPEEVVSFVEIHLRISRAKAPRPA